LHVSAKWLQAEAMARRIPCAEAGGVLLFHVPTVEALLVKRAKEINLGVPSVKPIGPPPPMPQVKPRARFDGTALAPLASMWETMRVCPTCGQTAQLVELGVENNSPTWARFTCGCVVHDVYALGLRLAAAAKEAKGRGDDIADSIVEEPDQAKGDNR